MALVTLEEAKNQLRVRHSEEDTDIELKMELATDLVLAYLELEDNVTGSPATWDDANVPHDVKAAVLAQLTELWQFRGDSAAPPRSTGGMLCPQAEAYLKMRRPIALA